MRRPVIIFGTGDTAQIAHFYLTHDSPYEVKAFTVDREYHEQQEFCGLPVVAFEELEQHYPPAQYEMLVALSYTKVNSLRARKYREAKEKGYTCISYVSTKATIWPGLKIGENCFILEDNTIQPFVEIGANVTLWSGNHIGHHSVIEDHCFISSHVVISGHVHIEPYCFLGVNATLRNGIRIKRESVIGAGALMLKHAKAKGVYIGTPATLFSKDSSQVKI